MRVIKPIDLGTPVSNVPEDEGAVWSAETSYAANIKVVHEHRVYTSGHDANLGNTPPDSLVDVLDGQTVPPWTDEGPTNMYKMFDLKVSSQTARDESIVVTIPAAKCSAVCLFGVDATSVRVVRTDAADIELLDTTVDLLLATSTSWFAYFWGDAEFRTDVRVPIPLAFTGSVTVTISKPGGTAKCGALFAGRGTFIGDAEYGLSSGIRDYSQKTTASDGTVTLVKGAYSKRMTVPLTLDNSLYDSVQKYLARLGSDPVAWFADEDEQKESFYVYGYYTDFDLVFADSAESTCSLTIEGLV